MKLCGTFGTKAFEPRELNEIGKQDIVDVVAEAVVFAGLADLVGIKSSRRIAVLHKDGEIDFGIAQHL